MADTLKQRIAADLRSAMRERQRRRIDALRMLTAAIKRKEIDDRQELGEADVQAVLNKLVRQYREAVKQFRDGGRAELADKEAEELACLEAYLPPPLQADELQKFIEQAIEETGATALKDMGRVMATLRERLAGRADLASVSAQLKQRLGS